MGQFQKNDPTKNNKEHLEYRLHQWTAGFTYLYTLGVHLLSFFVPTNLWLGVTCCLADKGDHTPRDTNLVNGNFCEAW